MVFWDEYLRNPPPQVNFAEDWPTNPEDTHCVREDWSTNPEDTHCVRWVGYEGGLEIDELWQFGREMRGISKKLPERDFTKYGGETLCGLKIESGRKMYGPRWRSIEATGYPSERPDEDNLRAVLMDLYGITCMACRNKLMYGVSRLIEDLTFIRSKLVGDWLGEEYISRKPLVHGKCVISSEQKGSTYSEVYRYRCHIAKDSINPQLVDDAKEPERITCQDCLANLAQEKSP